MSRFFGVMRHEFNMYLRRPGVWIAYLLLYAFYAVIMFYPDPYGENSMVPFNELWQFAGRTLFYGNMFMTLLAGILAADRMQRDFRLGVRELQSSTPFSLPSGSRVPSSTLLATSLFTPNVPPAYPRRLPSPGSR